MIQDLVVDTRNLIWLKSINNLVSMDITLFTTTGKKKFRWYNKSRWVKRIYTSYGKDSSNIMNGIFMEVHDNPDKSLCDAPTQFPLKIKIF